MNHFSNSQTASGGEIRAILVSVLLILFIFVFLWPVLVYEKFTRQNRLKQEKGERSLGFLVGSVLGSTVFTTTLYVGLFLLLVI